MKELTHYENIFIAEAKKEMKLFNIEYFKKDYRTLYKIIMKSILNSSQDGYTEGIEDAKKILGGLK
jgi:DNA-binding ferritin-like protein (Dps family)